MSSNTEVASILKQAIRTGAPQYNSGDVTGCVKEYLRAAKEASALVSKDINAAQHQEQLQQAIHSASSSKDVKEGAWILRECFDAILEDIASTAKESSDNKMETLEGLLKRTIKEGVPLYNSGDYKGCYELYFDTTKYACMQEKIARSAVGQLLEQAADEAMPLGVAGDYAEGAWVLRRCFDDILASQSGKSSAKRSSDSSMNFFRGATLRLSRSTAKKEVDVDNMPDDDNSTLDDGSSTGYWQDEKTQNTSDFEIGSCLSDFNYILRATVQPTTQKRFLTGKQLENSFPGSEAVEVLTGLGLARDRKTAAMKCSMLLAGGFFIALTSESSSFKDGTHLYRFSERKELQSRLDNLQNKGPHKEGSQEAQLIIALETTLDLPVGDDDEAKKFSGVSAAHLQPRKSLVSSSEQKKGIALANKADQAEKVVDIADRTYLLKTYEKCFVGKDAVNSLVENRICQSKEEAVEMMKELNEVGLIHHVLYDHGFENKQLFYRFTSPSALRKALDTIAVLPTATAAKATANDLVRHAALATRYQHHVGGFDVPSILNSFFGCEDPEGWDLVDLQNWRDNMKRWGFGRREDQDDAMVEKLAPLALNVDNPDTWFESLSDEEKEEWTSPWGILAQVAIFDQVPRSAFRGTAEAFKWDSLAIKASKLAIERGYFETAYKSTLNQFLVLLPLEHSESWEDQKLGVTLLLRLLSTVAVQDEGLSSYEVVKRLEFSKRLSTAFLEHAQVIAKFKHYPHRNKPLGRTTTLEERVWLASDLVPRWAKSQNPEDARKNVIQLPVIPLKKLTRG